MDASLRARLKALEDENRRLKKMYAEELLKAEIDFIDTTDCLMKNIRLDMLYYIQDNHLTNYGHEAVAQCIKEKNYAILGRYPLR